MAEQGFDQTAVESILAQADAEGFYEQSADDWQPEVGDDGVIVAAVTDAGIQQRQDKDTGIDFVNMKPILTVVEATGTNGKDLAGREFPLDRFGFASHNVRRGSEFGARNNMRACSVIAGEPVASAAACLQVWQQAAAAQTVLQITEKVREKDGKVYHNYNVTAVIDAATPDVEAPAAE